MSTEIRSDNPCFVLHGVHDARFEERPVPELEGDEVLVAVQKTGICGSDVHYLHHGAIGSFVVRDPMCLGHESAGVVVKLGPKAAGSGLKVGDRVALEPGMGCRTCPQCKAGLYELCPNMTFAATPPFIHGTLCRYYKLPADLLYLLPASVSLEDGAMMEPLAVAVHALSTLANVRTDQTVVVFGAGPVGLLCMAVAKALGARRVIAVDIQKERLEFAKGYAATDTFIPGESKADYTERSAETLRDALDVPLRGRGAIDVAIDASGAPVCIGTCIHLLKPGGTMVQVGMGPAVVPISMFHVITKQLRLLGSFRYGQGDYPLAISLVERGLVDLGPLVTHRYKFEQALEAFETTRAGKDKDGKPAIKCIIDAPL